ncbi:MAG: hypothetical protein SPJ06_00940 [Bacilli bacterium]|nr:hypothetical protein [Bacilli bacterium]
MNILIWIIYFILGLLMFYGVNYCRRKYSLSRVQSIIFSILIILVVSGITLRLGWTKFTDNIFVVLVFKFLSELVYSGYYLEEDVFKSRDNFYLLGEVVLGFIINQELINKVNDVFLSGNDLKLIIWVLIILYLYKFFKNTDVKNVTEVDERVISKEKIVINYAKFKIRFGEEIALKEANLKLIVYSIMILGDYRRGEFLRKIDNLIFKLSLKPRKLSIMQINSKKFITDYDGIELVCKKIGKISEKCKTGKNSYKEIFKSYDKENCDTLNYIYEELNKFCNL